MPARDLRLCLFGPSLSGRTTMARWFHAQAARHAPSQWNDTGWAWRGAEARLGDTRVCVEIAWTHSVMLERRSWRLSVELADAFLFVADRQEMREEANQERLEQLLEARPDVARGEAPLVFAWNKSDLPELSSKERLEELLNPHRRPSFSTVATRGEGLAETFEAALAALGLGGALPLRSG